MSTQDDTAPEGPPPTAPEGVAEGSAPSIETDSAADDGTAPSEPAALPEPAAEQPAEPELAPEAPEPAPAPAVPRKIVRTGITEAAYCAALGDSRLIGRADLVLVIECPESYDEADITAEAVAADPDISVISRVRAIEPEVEPAPEPLPAPEPEPFTTEQISAADLASAPVDSGEPPAPRKVARTTVTDAAHAEAIRALGGRAEPGRHDRVLMIECPEDLDETTLTADEIAQNPAIAVVSRVAPIAPEPEPLPAPEPSKPIGLVPESLLAQPPAALQGMLVPNDEPLPPPPPPPTAEELRARKLETIGERFDVAIDLINLATVDLQDFPEMTDARREIGLLFRRLRTEVHAVEQITGKILATPIVEPTEPEPGDEPEIDVTHVEPEAEAIEG